MEGVVYYNKGTKCLSRIATSIYSLRKYYNGPITILYEGEYEEWFHKLIKQWANIQIIPKTDQHPLVRKAQLWEYSPYEYTMFIDADTIILSNIDEYFDLIKKHGFVVGSFCDWITNGNKISKRIKEWESIRPDLINPALNYGKAINTGVFGWIKDHPILKPWKELTIVGMENNCTRRVVDELACQLLIPHYQHYTVNREWGASGKFCWSESDKIIHYHGNSHAGDRDSCYLWKNEFWKLCNSTDFRDKLIEFGDRSIRKYCRDIQSNNLTIVTAVNPGYLDKLKSNIQLWMNTDGLREYKYIIFYNELNEIDLDFTKNYKNIKLIKWEFPIAGNNIRERMVSAFVFGPAKWVTTPYWMKLDADTKPRSNKFNHPKHWNKFTITAHKWSYTRSKGANCKIHFLNILDNWWKNITGEEPIFPPNLPFRQRYGHPRIATFCSFENTEFTKKLAKLCDDRLPVPSQDTTAWYVANRLNMQIKRVNMKADLSP